MSLRPADRCTFPDLVFSDYVYKDDELKAVKEADETWQNRGNTALVCGEICVRHWNTYRGPKHQSLLSVKLAQKDGIWSLGEGFIGSLAGTTHNFPVESFGGKDDFDVPKTHVVYTALEPDRPTPGCLWHDTPSRTYSPIFSNDDTKVAWAELSEDGYESDCVVLVVYGLKDESHKLTPCWDKSPASTSFSEDDKCLYFTAGTEARVEVFVLQVPASKPNSNKRLASPFKPAGEHTTSAIQPLPGGRLLYLQNSFMKPNDVHITRGLEQLPASYDLDGAETKIQGWVLKPEGYSKNNRKWAPLSLIHGGPQSKAYLGLVVFAQLEYFVVAVPHLARLPLGKTSRMSSRKVVEESHLPISERDGNISSISISGSTATVPSLLVSITEDTPPRDRGGDVPSWIQKIPGFEFGLKALVCHDRYNGYSTDELFFFNHELDGQLWKNNTREFTRKFSPPNHVHKWSTPELIVRGNKDYGIAAFHALQQRGVPSRSMIFSDENHWVLNCGNGLKWYYEVFRWLDQFVGKGNTNRRCE
ncbi:hypothetical protein BDM02DRAFT_3193106 [Thelephora ganbajun]|uniref:Uncharacterized protein n=1 Tax=Thelephora ganbajun TaxID=370292 RepID=A0ACB6YYY1_THEGA|nr:hypothetical protein BDM02DRAFT_3193106 [Thelephora ganbajun]